jgi:hypothetical protein
MAKAILELPKMPESCGYCLLSQIIHDEWVCVACEIRQEVDVWGNRRADFCPLKLDESEG